MANSLNVMVLESERGAADTARAELARAGHRVLRCHDAGAAAFPCNALAAGRNCPLESQAVDVALDVRSSPRSQPAPQEDGVNCAIRQHVPLVVAGSPLLNPYEKYATTMLDRTYDVVEACEQAANAPLAEHTAAAAAALRDVLDRRSNSLSPIVAVRRQNGALHIEVRGAASLDRETRGMGAVRMVAAVRDIDSDARGVDVVFEATATAAI